MHELPEPHWCPEPCVLSATVRYGTGPTGERNVTLHVVPLPSTTLDTATLTVLLSGPLIVPSAAVRAVAVMGTEPEETTSTHARLKMLNDMKPFDASAVCTNRQTRGPEGGRDDGTDGGHGKARRGGAGGVA